MNAFFVFGSWRITSVGQVLTKCPTADTAFNKFNGHGFLFFLTFNHWSSFPPCRQNLSWVGDQGEGRADRLLVRKCP